MPTTQTNAPSRATPPRAIHPLAPICLCALALAAAFAFIPSKSELTHRLFQDGEHLLALRAAANLQTTGPAESTAAEGEATAAADPSADGGAGEAERMREALANPSRFAELAGDGAGRRILAVAVVNDPDAAARVAEVARRCADLDSRQQELVLRAVADRALDTGRPQIAALAYSSLMQLHPETVSAELLAEVVRSWRANAKPDQALACLDAWVKEHQLKPEQLPAELADVRLHLLFENDRASDALDTLLEQLQREKASGAGVAKATLTQAAEAAGYCGRIIALRPYVLTWLGAQPLGQMSLADLCAAVRSGKAIPHDAESFGKFALDLAHWCEWDGQPDEAMPLYCKLAVLGNAEALDRAMDIAQDCGFSGPLLEVLDAIMLAPAKSPHPAPVRRAYCRLLALAGRFSEAIPRYAAWLAENPQDADALAEMAAVHEEMGQLDAALASWRGAARLNPDNMDNLKRQAEICIDLRRESEALAIYEKLTAEQHDSVTLENYALLAESLGRFPQLNNALLLRFARIKSRNTQDYLELARSYSLIGREDSRLQCLRDGMAALPQSRTLRRQLAAALQENDLNTEVVEILEIASTRDDLRAFSLYIVSASQSAQFARARKFIGRSPIATSALPADVRLHLGHVYYQTGSFTEARSLYASVDSNASTWPLLADACSQIGDFAEAEKYQRRYVEEFDAPPAEALMKLGDLCRRNGKESEAQIAYDQALEIIRSRHGRENAPPPKISFRNEP